MREGENRLRARHLRRNLTDAEKRLWFHLRASRFFGHKFQRQKTIGPYIVDFCCHESRLILELDGGQHGTLACQEKDLTREMFLKSRGYAVIRFWNHDVLANTEGVLQRIEELLKSKGRPLPGPLPLAGEGENRAGCKERFAQPDVKVKTLPTQSEKKPAASDEPSSPLPQAGEGQGEGRYA